MNKIKQYFFYKDGEFSWWKSIQNILLIYVVSYLIGLYYDLFYNPLVRRISFDCLDCGLPVFLMGILCYILAFVISILNLFYAYFEKRFLKRVVKLIEFAVFVTILYFYRRIISECGNPICFLHPFSFPAVVWAFILIFKKSKYFTPFFIILFLIPASIIITDDIIQRIKINNFYSTCKQIKQQEIYSPLLLPLNYFSENNKDGKQTFIPNVIQGQWPLSSEKYKNNIQDIGWCSQDKSFVIISAINNGAVILCKESQGNKIVVKQILEDNKTKDIAQISSLNVFWSYSRLAHLLNLTHIAYVCNYPNRKYWNPNVVPYENYIKPQ